MDDLAEQFRRSRSQKEEWQDSYRESERRVADMVENCHRADDERDALATELVKARVLIQQRDQQINELTDRATKLQQKVALQEQDLKILSADLASQEGAGEQLLAVIRRCGELQDELGRRNETIQHRDHQLQACWHDLERYQDRLEKANLERKALQHALTSSQEAHQAGRKEVGLLRDELGAIRTGRQDAAIRDLNAKLRDKLNLLRQQNELLEAQCSAWEKECQKARTRNLAPPKELFGAA